jgi:peptide/nickel transport system ATP-binding protein
VREALLILDQVSKTHRRSGSAGVIALMEVDLELRRGEALGMCGPNGAGKSTLARLALGLERPDAGRVQFDGRDLASMSARELWLLRRSVQIVWQDPSAYLNPYQSVIDSVAEPMEVFRIDRRAACRRRAAELMDLVQLPTSVHGRRPYELSGGQCQRVAIARALSLGPSLLICDEALSGLDMAQQVRVLELLARLRSELELSLLFISHDRAVARVLCDRLVEMRDGRLDRQPIPGTSEG